MEHSPPLESDILPGTEDIRHIPFFILNAFFFSYRVLKIPVVILTLIQTILVHILPYCFGKVFSIIFQPTPSYTRNQIMC